ncbi:PLP-dependent aminotransferase family protein [Nocardioides sp. cx-173]|uniref:MocR-like transcription factor YczR n=1 Tax=Nocardioides sp. cx-173 TaxID=2898796 RepID=UPI001E60C4AB|nr:PLP-dependent aminotransferase family protein [Nocardioides sp. cx-173]MCD4524678.1 PLP-dependent aminotransferase family protein [Nocardioides sp. cx-173]UGB43188.1 PLP-dependent aminotransferase family protein [Nocardioides sp. cx-173]
MSTSTAISAARTAALVGDFDRTPAYAGLADALRLLIGDGRIGFGTRLPSERELTEALGVSRTTVTRAYATLRDTGYAEARQGSGTFTRVPGGRARAHDRALLPRAGDHEAIDLNCAAASAPPGVAAAYAEAASDLPAYFGGHGYFPAGLPELQAAIAATYEARGLPTTPEQVMVTPGALSAAAIVAQAYTGPGDRVLVESPVYPNATLAIRHSGARLTGVPVDPDGWDLGSVAAALRQTSPRLAYLIPDFQNPTGHLMTEAQREEYAALLRRAGTVAVVDEAHQALALDGQEMPRPFAAFAPETITLGSASKTYWGGLRLGWIRAPEGRMDQLTTARVGLDLGAPVMEQLVLARLLARGEEVVDAHRERLREQRDRLAAGVREQLPDWRFHLPGGGLALWLQLPGPLGTALTDEAERRGVIIAPGPVFAAEGGLDQFVRVPWTRPPHVMEEAVARLAEAWSAVRDRQGTTPRGSARVMVA